MSYSSDDLAAASRVNEQLKAAGLDVWFDKTAITAGDDWDNLIRTHIEECFLFLPILSRHTAVPSGYFIKEWRWAVERATRIGFGLKFAFPIVVDDSHVDPARLPDLFTRMQWTVAPRGELLPEFIETLRQAYRTFQMGRN